MHETEPELALVPEPELVLVLVLELELELELAAPVAALRSLTIVAEYFVVEVVVPMQMGC